MPLILVFLIVLFSGCASREAAPPPPTPQASPPSLELRSAETEVLSFETALLRVELTVYNPDNAPLRLEQYRYTLQTRPQDGRISGQKNPELNIPAGEKETIELTLQLPLGPPLPADHPENEGSVLTYTLSVEAQVTTGSQKSRILNASSEGRLNLPRLPRIRVPEVIIRQFEAKIIRLEYMVEVHNPNPFPLHYTPQPHEFSFAGNVWAREALPGQFRLAAGESKRIGMPLQINYLKAGRRTVDILIGDKTMQYTLSGQAETPSYRFSFQNSGAATLIRP